MTSLRYGAPDPAVAAARLGVAGVIGCPCRDYEPDRGDTCTCGHLRDVHSGFGNCLDWVPYNPTKAGDESVERL